MRIFKCILFLFSPIFLIASANHLKFDEQGRIISGKNSKSQFQRIYNERNNLICENWSNGLSLIKVYNEENQLIQIQFPHGKILYIDGDGLEYDGHIRIAVQKNDWGQITLENFSHLEGTLEYFYDSDKLLQKIEGFGITIPFPKKDSNNLFDDHFHPIKIHGEECAASNLGQILRTRKLICEYDALGRLIKKTTPEREVQFSYDEYSQLIRIQCDNITVHNVYDALGRKIEKEIWQGNEKINHEYYLYDGIFEIAAFDENLHLKEIRILDPKNPLRTAFLEREGTVFYPLCTQHGHTFALLSPTHAPRVVHNFPIFGEDSSKLLHPWAYSGHRFDPDIYLYCFGRRHYDPEIISWTTPDPLGQLKENPYCYLFGDPNRYIDLDGCWGIALPVFEFLAGIAAEVVEAALVAGGTANAIENCEEVYDWWQERKKQKEAYKTELEEEKDQKKPPYDGKDLGDDPDKCPGEDFTWKGDGNPENGKGSWYNPKTGESLHPDLKHPAPKKPHWDYENPSGEKARLNIDGTWEWKK